MRDLMAQFMTNVAVFGEDECWEWMGRTTRGDGNGDRPLFRFRCGERKRRELSARHWMYETHHNTTLEPWTKVASTCSSLSCVNPAHLVLSHQGFHLKQKRTFRDAAKNKPCMDCGKSYPPYVMDFDHRPGEEKLFELSDFGGRPLEALAAEIEKCDLVCSNCHRERSYQRAWGGEVFGRRGGKASR